MTVLLPDWENCGKPQIIMIISSKINYLCASAARCGKSVSVLGSNKGSMWVLLCVCVCGRWGVGGGGLGVMGQVGFMFQSLLASVPFCSGRIVSVHGPAVKDRVWLSSFCGFVSPLCYLFVRCHRRSGSVWLDASILSFVLSDIHATTCHVVIRAQSPRDGACFNISKPTFLQLPIRLCQHNHIQLPICQGKSTKRKGFLFIWCEALSRQKCNACLRPETKHHLKAGFLILGDKNFASRNMHQNVHPLCCIPAAGMVQMATCFTPKRNQSACSRPANSRQISDPAADRARAQHALSCS